MSEQRPLQLYLHYFNYRWRARGEQGFDIHDLIDDAAALGFSGVNLGINNLPHLFLKSDDPSYLAEIRAHLEERDLGVDTEVNGTEAEALTRDLHLTRQLGADYLRTYTVPFKDGRDQADAAVAGLSAVAPLAEELGITLLLENHEDLTATEVASVLDRVNHPRVQALFDYGNSAIFMEEPAESVHALGRYTHSAHLKDHVTIPAGVTPGVNEPMWLGVPLGEGYLPIVETTKGLQAAGMTRVCFENCWAYDTTFRDRRGTGELGSGIYELRKPPYDPRICLPGYRDPANLEGLDMPRLEESVMHDSTRWLERSFRKEGITLERPLRV
jgi:sugar phosphate isomerase/epimerase